jgi:hypothetical protein
VVRSFATELMVFRKMAGDMGLKWPVRPIFGCQRDPLARSFLTTT